MRAHLFERFTGDFDQMAARRLISPAVAIRKNGPLLGAELNAFLAKNGLGTALGNMIEKRYLANTSYAKQATAEADRKKFRELGGFFQEYGEQYRLDYLLMAAQGYRESRARPECEEQGRWRRRHAGHAGHRQGDEVGDITKGPFAFASYNAGPGRVRQLRKEGEKRGLDPNVWFGNVEQVASERIGRETVAYVSNIYKYYIAYRLVAEDGARGPRRRRRSRRTPSRLPVPRRAAGVEVPRRP